MRYVLNSAVITAPGFFEYRLISVEEAIKWINKGPFKSTVGYEETAEALSQLLGIVIPVNRCQISMEQGDEALIFRLVFPPGTPRLPAERKGLLTPEWVLANSEIGILTRFKEAIVNEHTEYLPI